MIPLRNQVPLEDQWDLTSLFSTDADWQQALTAFLEENMPPTWPKIAALQGTLNQGPAQVKKALETTLSIRRQLESLYVYAHLKRDVNTADDTWSGNHKRIMMLFQDFGVATSWFDPELLGLSEKQLKEIVEDSSLSIYQVYLQKIIRMKPHTLPKEQERLIAQSDKALATARRAFSAFNDSDLTFPPIVDSEGKEHELTLGSYSLYIYHPDRTLRKNAFKSCLGTYGKYKHLLCELLTGNAERNVYVSRARGYKSSLEAALDVNNIDVAVYHSLISTVREHLDGLHDYMQLRKEVLGIDTLHPYDFNVSLVKDYETKIPYDEGRDLVVESVAPLGAEYQNALKEGLNSARWVDRYENRYKRSGAYSSGSYDSVPFILMNYKGLIRDVSTLAHEAGHSMHSYFSTRTQNYHDYDYPIFVAEVASTFNEQLLADLMIERAKSDEEKIFLLNQQVEEIRGTLFRQTLFAEFELFIHTALEQQQPLTSQVIQAHYVQLLKEYYGPAVTWDDEIAYEEFRIPHFYSSFYVYQYATGLSAAIALAHKIRQNEPGAKERYLEFLKSGCSRYPLDLLERAGIDMRSKEPVTQAMLLFKELVAKLRALLVKK